MVRRIVTLLVLVCLGGWCCAQQQQSPKDQPSGTQPNGPGPNQEPPRSDQNKNAEGSSSRDTRIDISPPSNDAQEHPFSAGAVSDATGDSDDAETDVQEFHPWDPHKALKDVEVGDFYFKRKNYRAALDRYKEALVYKNNDAVANFRMAQCLEKLANPQEATVHYQEYLKILPHGPFSEEAQKSLQRLEQKKQGEGKQ